MDAATRARKRIPMFEAITISRPIEGESYNSVMKKVMNKVNLQDIGVQINKVRKPRAGAILLEVKGKEAADCLSCHLHEAVGESAQVSRPTRTMSVFVLNIAEWLEEDKVKEDIMATDPMLIGSAIRVRSNIGGGRVAQLSVSIETAAELAKNCNLPSQS